MRVDATLPGLDLARDGVGHHPDQPVRQTAGVAFGLDQQARVFFQPRALLIAGPVEQDVFRLTSVEGRFRVDAGAADERCTELSDVAVVDADEDARVLDRNIPDEPLVVQAVKPTAVP